MQILEQKGIITEDIFYLFKEFHTVDTIMAQPDEVLKDSIHFSGFNGYVTNMYGTYSQSQGGAHEGIDFAYGTTGTTIYAIFDGKVLSGGLSHQLSVYDSNVSKTYNYLHMDSKSVSSGATITHGKSVGKQGMQGNATGPHVHFEVHSGSTTGLSIESDDVLGSISPYQLQIYLGEL